MPTSLKAKLFAAASVDAGLVALLKDGAHPFRWFDIQLPQNWPKGSVLFPAVTVQLISNPRSYAVTGKIPTSFNRVQFTVYGTGNDSQNAELVVNAIDAFLQTFSGSGLSVPAYPNYIVGDRDAGIADTNPLTYMRILDANVFNDDSI